MRLRQGLEVAAGLVSVVVGAALPATAQQVPAPVVRAQVDRTAVWIADRVDYTVEIVCPKTVDILPDDLAGEKLKSNGLELLKTETTESTSADEVTTHRIRYELATYRVDAPALTIDPLVVRYFAKRPGQRPQEAAPAGEVQVPPQSIAFRSMLPDDASGVTLRDRKTPAERSRRLASARSAGVAMMLVSVAPLAFVVVGFARRQATRQHHRSARKIRHDERMSLDALRSMDVGTDEDRRRAYDAIDALVRTHLSDACGVPGQSLTPAEIPAALAARRSHIQADTVAALLSACEQARYAPAGGLPGAEACREAIAEADRLLSTR